MEEFDATNRAATSSDNNILFVGSSSFRRWENMATDMILSNINPVRAQVVRPCRLRRPPHHPQIRTIVFVANDIGGKGEDKSPRKLPRWPRMFLNRPVLQP